MAANVICCTLSTAMNYTGPDSLTGNAAGSSSQIATGGSAAITARYLTRFLDDFATGGIPILSPTVGVPMPYPELIVMDGATRASQIYTFSGTATANDTVTINAQALTAVSSAPGNNQWLVGATAAASAANLVTCINASTTAAINETVRAYIDPANSAIVVVTCIFGGVIGNLVTTAKSSTDIAVGAGTCTGGASNAVFSQAH